MTDTATFKVGDMVEVVGPIDKSWPSYAPALDLCVGRVGEIYHTFHDCTFVDFGEDKWTFPPENIRHAKANAAPAQPDKWAHIPTDGKWMRWDDGIWHYRPYNSGGCVYLPDGTPSSPHRCDINHVCKPADRCLTRAQAIAIFEAHAATDHIVNANKRVSDEPAFKVGDMVEVVGPIDEDWESYVPDLEKMIGRSGKIIRIVYEAHMVSFGEDQWNFRPENLRHAQADDNEGIDGLTDEEIDREVNYQLGFAQRRIEILTDELAVMRAHAGGVERERDKLRAQCHDSLSIKMNLNEMLATVRARADRAEHFVRIIAGLRPGHIGESEAGQLVRTAQATLQPITAKGTP